jgi:hypothetical protein
LLLSDNVSYNAEEPPPTSFANSTEQLGRPKVQVGLKVFKLKGICPEKNEVSVTSRISRYWYDPRLSIGSLKEAEQVATVIGKDGAEKRLKAVAINPSEIWTPDVDLVEKTSGFQESCSTVAAVLFDKEEIKAILNNTDIPYNLQWVTECTLTFKCHIDMKNFPYDIHNCAMTLAPSADISYDTIVYDEPTAELDTTAFRVEIHYNSTVDTNTLLPGGLAVTRQGVQFNLLLVRIPHFFVVNLLFPMILLVVIGWFSFFTPIESHDRMSYSVTLLLAAMAVQFITAGFRPQEDADGFIDEFMIACYGMISTPILESAYLYRVLALTDREAEKFDENSVERREIELRGRERVLFTERIMRVLYPVVYIILMALVCFKRGRIRSGSNAVTVFMFATGPGCLVIFCFSVWTWIQRGPCTRAQLDATFCATCRQYEDDEIREQLDGLQDDAEAAP